MRSFPPGCLALGLFLIFIVLLPFFLAEAFLSALSKLGLNPQQSVLAALGIFFGSMFNIPIFRVKREEPVEWYETSMYGFGRSLFQIPRKPQVTVLAVNVGGCLVPLIIAVYQIVRLAGMDSDYLVMGGIAVLVNIIVCERLAKPIPNMGLAIPALVPALLAVVCALLLVPDQAPSVAFTAGVLGPLIGADILHLREIKEISTGMASIGGAGTFDGIVLSGIVATLLA